jgi:PAS domain S-box-containing protein
MPSTNGRTTTLSTLQQNQDAAARARLAAIVRSSADAIIGETLDGIITDWNPAAERLYGYSAAEVIGQHLSMVVPPQRMAEVEEILVRVHRGEHVTDVETERWTKDGRRVDVSLTISPVWNDAREMTGTSAIVRDITDRKTTQHELAASEALLRVAFENAPIGMILTNPDGQLLQVNRALCEMLGYTPDELLATGTWSFTHAEDIGPNQALMQRALRGELDSYQFEKRYLHRDGQIVWGRLSGSLVRDDEGAPRYFISQIENITARKATDDALAVSEERFRIAFADAPTGMALVGADERILQVNWTLCTMLGHTEAELLGTTLRSHTHPDDIAANQVLVERARAGEVDHYALEKRYLRKDGGIVWAALTASCVRDETGTIRYYISQIQDITERKTIEAELVTAHHETQQVLERITDGFFALDLGWRFTHVNEAAELFLGRGRDALLGESIWELFAPAVDTPLYPTFQRAMVEGTTQGVEFYYAPLNGWFDVRVYPSPEGLSVFFRDVTASRELAHELRSSEERYRTLMQQLPAVVYVLNADEAQTPLYFSPYIETLTGFSPEEAMARDQHWLEHVHPDDRERVAAVDAQTTATGEAFRVEYRHLRKDGSCVWVLDDTVEIRDEAGATVAWQGVLLDISARVAAEEGQARLAAIVASAEDAIVSSDLDGTITSWNQGAARVYGYSAAEILGQPFTRLLADNVNYPLLDERRAAAASGHPVAPFESTRRRRDGTTFEASISLSPIVDRNGHVVGVSTITRDITAQTEADAALRVALEAAKAGIRAKTLFLAMMSHELRTPLQAVLGYADFLLNGPPGSLTVEQREDLSSIRQGAGRMATLIEQLLDLTRMEAGRLELAAVPVDLATIIEQVRQDIAPQLSAKALDCVITVPAALPPVLGDPVRLRQILLNLAANAVKFTDAGFVRISAVARSGGVEVAIQDTGIGISEEDLPSIFEEFRQVDANLSRRYGGAGLGLAIASGLAEQMGGRITVTSTPGTGSTFTLHLVATPPAGA